jgi:hypothetical protein
MKHLLLSLALILSANVWADDEFPIELTCEMGPQTVFFYLNATNEGSWYKLDESNPEPLGMGYKRGKKTVFKKNKYTVGEKTIDLSDGNFVNIISFQINRYSLGIQFIGPPNNNVLTGQCYKGFKEYEKQI